jgi:endonuclease/exonuclease/phosphatase family metal-dependent hydrolase
VRITLATWNIHGCVGTDRRWDVGRTAAVIDEIDPHVIALQEVDNRKVGARELLDHLAGRAGFDAVAGPTLIRRGNAYGNALLTRLPLLGVDRIDLSLPRREPRGAIDAELDGLGRPIRIVATHLGLRAAERRLQMRRLLSRFESRQDELSVLAGDLNEWLLQGRPLRWLRRQFPPTPNLPTYPARFPLFALDRIWVRPARCLESLAVHDTPLARVASDHLPLKAFLNTAATGTD